VASTLLYIYSTTSLFLLALPLYLLAVTLVLATPCTVLPLPRASACHLIWAPGLRGARSLRAHGGERAELG
uniref:Uncharacterized protein n=1 Tax=Aegilops tauschii subsp. strangulata TaxID=200361 RepID=A0A453ED62_AEGTS